MKKAYLAIILLLIQIRSFAQREYVERSADILCLAPAVTGLAKACAEDDWQGVLKLGLSSATGIALNYGLNASIAKDRPQMPENPGWSDRHSFPSTHTMAAFDGSTFLIRRYGWKWGVPAYAVSTYVAWSRIHSGQHNIWDILGGAAVGVGSALLYTRPRIKDKELVIAPATFGDGACGLYAALKF